MNSNHYCVIMAGGFGSRFWPLSRNSKPKQFLDILGVGRTFIQQTFDRYSQIVPVENIIVVTSEAHKELVCRQLPDILPQNILLEPYKRNTAPCLAYATYLLYQRNPDATMVVTPSDHFITNEAKFITTINTVLEYASSNDDLFTIGVEPTRPETQYGYIQVSSKENKNIDGHIVYGVKTFTEKPIAELAQAFVDSGEFLWNSGIFVWSVKSIKREMERWVPEIARQFRDGEALYGTNQEREFIEKVYVDCPTVSIDHGVMEKTSKAYVFKAPFGWSDLGTWDSLYSNSPKDSSGNLVRVDELLMDKMTNSVIISTNKGKLIAVKGLDNYVIVDTPDVLAVCPRDEKRLKNILTDLAVNDKVKFQ